METQKRNIARGFRIKGCSINEIVKYTNFSKSSVSLWVRDVKLTKEQKRRLSEKGIKKETIEQRRATRLKNEDAKRQLIIDDAQKRIKKLSEKELWLIGTMLYWAEGGKTERGLVRFSNGDPEMIKFMMVFFRNICKVPEKKFRAYIHIHPYLDSKKAEKYWSYITKIPLANFFKTYQKPNRSSKNKRHTLPHGTLDIYICNTELFLKIFGWVKGIFKQTNPLPG
ncbi:MAG: hypothetical protein A2174_01805 [Candidatus Portnoybacteria bacterium RBG_13_41_18]|uniref:Uncharacterized protein n=1 Tax=Candidatus Portnoybacteria bacterium RBG_13_41_18 TaxID=1801991 RepID=A0A1G2F7W4_9BACT|nr:MAG: hypothetical protein A2174_01805 [Candidatus Portnoybacteria bacterium RBG_13_41_18]